MESARESSGADAQAPPLADDERRLLDALRAGDEAAFAGLVVRYQPALLRLAMAFVSSRAIAEEVVQDTWVGVIEGLGRFEGRSSLKTWIFRILTNRARSRGEREGRSIAFADLAASEARAHEPAVDPSAFWPADHPRWGNGWVAYPRPWDRGPEDQALSGELQRVIRSAIEALAPTQRTVITLRDIEGWTAADVCNALEITETNQRVLLHRARARVRAAIERYQQGA